MNIHKVLGVDRFGNEIKIGTELIYTCYDRDADLYLGKVKSETSKTIKIGFYAYGDRVVKKTKLKEQVIVKPENYVDQKEN